MRLIAINFCTALNMK